MIDDTATIGRACMLLAVVVDELRLLRRDLAERKASAKQPRVLSSDDMRALTPLLPAAVKAVGGAAVSVRSLREAAGARTPEAKSLRAALTAAAPDHLRLGHLFRRAALSETPICSLFVHRLGKSHGSVVFDINSNTPSHNLASGVAAALRGRIET